MTSRKRFDVAVDRGFQNAGPVGAFYVVDMKTVHPPDSHGVNVGIVAGPFTRIGEAFDVATRMNRPWWKRLFFPFKGNRNA